MVRWFLPKRASKRRASLHILAGEESLGSIDAGGIDIFSSDLDEFRANAHCREPHAQEGAYRSASAEWYRQRIFG